MTATLAQRLAAAGRAIAAAAVRRRAQRLAGGWAGEGGIREKDLMVDLRAPGLARRRLGSRTTLADPALLWPGDGQ